MKSKKSITSNARVIICIRIKDFLCHVEILHSSELLIFPLCIKNVCSNEYIAINDVALNLGAKEQGSVEEFKSQFPDGVVSVMNNNRIRRYSEAVISCIKYFFREIISYVTN
jgi:hypothetical protein